MGSFFRRSSQIFATIVELCFFFMARIAGILPISLDSQNGKVQMSHFLVIYSLLLAILLTITIPISIFVLLEMMNVFEDTMMMVVSIIEYFMSYAVAIVVLYQNICMSSRMAKVVNAGFPMYKSLPQVVVDKLRRRFYIYVLIMSFGGIASSAMNIAMNGRVEIIANDQGNRITPSYVAFTAEGERLIGDAAKNQLTTNPENTVFDAKRLIGQSFLAR
uniref:Uncharacterized protein n=2 Tax=Lutzomyia longipalpis TaxID=7200 RepID=A0A1B0CCS8_LUTLO